ncbi:6-phosphogluconolactonase [Psychrobium sp. nBUS_13]|uniref:6-phosphogluconolactonase n=1 Tax=Psychrobium sp. nBUS_13 TaxID=3395319 RepID=UPI003EB76FD5
MNITEFNNSDEITNFLANDISEKLTAAINERGQGTLFVSGGRSPIALFEQLSHVELDWSKVVISLVDDRWVDDKHESSNELLVNTHLLKNNASAATFIGLVGQEQSAFDGAENATARISDIKIIDALILGMGEDGHTASIFPCSEQVDAAMATDNQQRLIATQPTTAPYERISLTLNEILAAKQVYLPLSGSGKVGVFEQARVLDDVKQMPIAAVIKQHNALDVLISQ